LAMAYSMGNLGKILDYEGKFAEAEPLFRNALMRYQKSTDEEEKAFGLGNVAENLRHLGKLDEAEADYRAALAIWKKLFGPKDNMAAYGLAKVAALLEDKKKWPEAESMLRAALEIQTNLPAGQPTVGTAVTLTLLSNVVSKQGRFKEAENLARTAVAIRQKLHDTESYRDGMAVEQLAWTLQQQGQFAEAEPLHRQALAIIQKSPVSNVLAASITNINRRLTTLIMHQVQLAEPAPDDPLKQPEMPVPANEGKTNAVITPANKQ